MGKIAPFKTINKNTARAGVLQLLAALCTLLPLCFLNKTAFIGNSDALFYSLILKLTAQHMALGEWLPEANGGIGSPVMHYYSLLAYQITAILGAPIASIDPLGYKRLLLGMVAAQWVGGMAAWAWISRHASARNALIVSMLFTLFPYKWIYIYLHINLAQLWALAWLPLLMMAAEDMAQAKRNASLKYGLWLALILLTHPRTLVAFAAVPALYVLVFSLQGIKSVIMPLIKAHVLSLAPAAFYLLPALLNIGLVQTALANGGRMHYAENLSHRDLLYNFHYAVIAFLLIGLRLRLPELRHTIVAKQMLFWLGILFAVTFLCTRLSQPIWDYMPPLQFLQFPAARLHAAALIAACALAALFFELCNYKQVSKLYSPATVLASVAVMTVMVLNHVYSVYQGADVEWTYINRVHALNLILPPEYLTQWQKPGDNSLEKATSNAQMPLVLLTKGQGKANARFEGNTILIDAAIESHDATLRLRQLYWPAWHSSGIQLSPDNEGLMTLQLPEGKHNITITMQPLPGETAGRIISLLAWVMLGLALYKYRRDAIERDHGYL